MPKSTLSVFDPHITRNSPAGSCLLKMLQAAAPHYNLRLFTSKTDLQSSDHILIYKIPLPARPVLLQNILFAISAAVFYLFTPAKKRGLTISTQGAVPFCHVCYCHSPHKLFLTRYRRQITGGLATRTARILNYKWIAALENIAFKLARVVVVPSQGLADELAGRYGESIASKIRVNVNPVDCESFSPSDSVTIPRPFTFAFCALGNFEWKGLALIIQALGTGLPGHLKVIGGNASEIRHYKTLAQLHGVDQQVTFVGLQSDVRPHLWTSDVFVFPSVHESFGLVCFQAAAAGLPLIATNLYALSELLQPGLSGWRVDRTVESIAAAMRYAVTNPAQTAQMGRNARSIVQKYNEPAFQQRWLDLLKTLQQD